MGSGETAGMDPWPVEERKLRRVEEKTQQTASLNVPYLVVLAGDVNGRVIRLVPGRKMAAGRSRRCEVFLDDRNISRVHAHFTTDRSGQTTLEDAGSTNGTLVNGKRVDVAQLQDGDRICMGNVILRYSLKDDLEYVCQHDLFEKATKDQLTGIYNKAFFLDAFRKEFTYHRRYNKPLSLLMLDLDNFKKINDIYGHVNGDVVLRSVCREMSQCLRTEDLLARYGGEEFAVLFRNTGADTARRIARKLLQLVRSMKFSTPSAEFKISMTVGMATYLDENFDSMETMIIHADRNLYVGKRKGKNQVIS